MDHAFDAEIPITSKANAENQSGIFFVDVLDITSKTYKASQKLP